MTTTPPDVPLFDPVAFRLTEQQAALITTARELGQNKFAARAAHYDREAIFPTENYHDLYQAGLMGICIPQAYGGHGADFATYALAAAEIGRFRLDLTSFLLNIDLCQVNRWKNDWDDDHRSRKRTKSLAAV